jgi:hypothetical protein
MVLLTASFLLRSTAVTIEDAAPGSAHGTAFQFIRPLEFTTVVRKDHREIGTEVFDCEIPRKWDASPI